MIDKAILLVEDNPDDAVLTKRAFRKAHIENEIITVHDGVEAIDYLFGTGKYAGRDPSDCPSLVLLDLNLPRMNGLEVLRHMRADERTRRIQVVVMTTSREDCDVAGAYNSGANSYVCKPVDFAQFVRAAQEIGLYWLVLNEPVPALTK